MSETTYRHIRARSEQGVLVITILEKEVRDYEVCLALRQELGDAFRRSQVKNVVVDFSAVEFMASSGFLPLLNLNRMVSTAGGRMVLSDLSEFVRGVLQATRLLISPHSPTGLFEAEANVPSAIANLAR